MNKKILYRAAYRYLNDVTPLKIDCGSLCGKACCKGDSDTGMQLFPGEEALQEQNEDIKIRSVTNAEGTTPPIKLAVCDSNCVRELRPLSCRIFPLIPYLASDGRLEIKMDSRASALCPLAQYSDAQKLNRFFIRKVRKVFQLLLKDNDIRNYVAYLSELQDEFEELNSIFHK